MSAPVPSPTPAPVSAALRHTTVGAVLLVATVAAVMSYAHMQHVAHREGEAWRSFLLPLSVDGLMVAASMVLLARRRAGLPGGVLPWTALLAGVAASLAANVAAAEPTPTARIVAAWPALAFAVAFELLLQQRRPLVIDAPTAAESPSERDEHRLGDDVAPSTASVSALPRAVPADIAPAPAMAPTAPAPTAPAPGQPSGEAALAARAAALIAAADGRSPGRRVLARELGCTEHRARLLLETLSTNAMSANGTGPAGGGGRQ